MQSVPLNPNCAQAVSSTEGSFTVAGMAERRFRVRVLRLTIHDSRHIFVEVDNLGGTVRNFLASDHDSFVPNNLYSTPR